MSKSHSIVAVIAAVAAGGLLLVCGCARPQTLPAPIPPRPVVVEPNVPEAAVPEPAVEEAPAVELALSFSPGQTATYRVTTEAAKSAAWEGDASTKPAAFEGGQTGHHTEIAFVQRVESVDGEGNATLKITIEAFKYLTRRLDTVDFDFDSARPADQDSPLARLVGLGYTIELSPQGEVLAVTDVAAAREALAGGVPELQIARAMLDERAIKARHEVPALEALSTPVVEPGQRWSDITSLDFGTMGVREFERIYTLEDVEMVEGGRIAAVTMGVIPSAALAQQQHLQQQTNPIASMFDTTESYEGRLELDLTAGEIVMSAEQLEMQWVAVDPAGVQPGAAEPAILKMGATQLYRLERID